MFLNAHIQVTIGTKLINTIVSVHMKNDGHQVGSECDIVIPLICSIRYIDGSHDFLTQYSVNSQQTFNSGDPVLVTAKYDGYDTVTVFRGFVFDLVEGTPMTIKCLDYSYFFNLGIFGTSRVFVNQNKSGTKGYNIQGTFFASITLKNLLQKVVDYVNQTISNDSPGTPLVTLYQPDTIPQMNLVNITFAQMSPLAILNYFMKNCFLNIKLLGNQLYCNVASGTTNTITYRTDRNVLKSELQKPAAVFQSFKVKAYILQDNGLKTTLPEIGDPNGHLKEVWLNKLDFGKENNMNKWMQLANEALNKCKQRVYGGNITTLLYPYPVIFAKANYTDIRYPARTGDYVISAYETTIDGTGYRNKIKLSYLNQIYFTND